MSPSFDEGKLLAMAFLGKYFREHDSLRNKWGQREHWPQLGAWLIFADLARRNPGRFSVVEGVYPAGGTVWFLKEKPDLSTPVLAAKTIGTFNENGHIDTIHSHPENRCPIAEDVPERSDQRILTIAPVVMGQLREITLDIERCAGLPQPTTTPPTSSESIGWWVVATVLALYAHSKTRLRVGGVLWDGVSPSQHILESFPALSHLLSGVENWATPNSNARIEPETALQLSGLMSIHTHSKHQNESSTEESVLVIDLHTGVAHTKRRKINLMDDYRQRNRNIESVAFHTIETALDDSKKHRDSKSFRRRHAN